MTMTSRDFWLAVRREPTRTHIAAGGRLVLGHGADMSWWRPYIDDAAGQAIDVDLGGVTEMDARALGLLVELARATAGGATIRFVRASARVARLVRLTGLDAVLPFSSKRGDTAAPVAA
jgi:anti-anti-sigma factor